MATKSKIETKIAIRKKITNPFYDKIKKEGADVIGETGEKAGRTKVTNPYFHTSPGRPRKDAEKITPTATKSIRLPIEMWMNIDEQAAREGKSRHAALREAVLIWLQS